MVDIVVTSPTTARINDKFEPQLPHALGGYWLPQLSCRTEFAADDIVVLYNFNNGYASDGSPLFALSGQPVIRFNFLYNLPWSVTPEADFSIKKGGSPTNGEAAFLCFQTGLE